MFPRKKRILGVFTRPCVHYRLLIPFHSLSSHYTSTFYCPLPPTSAPLPFKPHPPASLSFTASTRTRLADLLTNKSEPAPFEITRPFFFVIPRWGGLLCILFFARLHSFTRSLDAYQRIARTDDGVLWVAGRCRVKF